MEDYQMPTGLEGLPAVQEHLLPCNTRCQKIRRANFPLISKGKGCLHCLQIHQTQMSGENTNPQLPGTTGNRLPNQCDTFRTAMFPTPPEAPPAPPIPPGPSLQWPAVTPT